MSRDRQPSRRDLLASGTALSLAASLARLLPGAAAQSAPQPVPPSGEPLFRLSLAEWSYHRALRSGQMQHLDFPSKARLHGLDGCEYVNQFFEDKVGDRKYLRELTKRCDDNGVRSLLIMCDGVGDLCAADDAVRHKVLDDHVRWIEAGSFLGCHSVRVNLSGQGTREELAARGADSLHRLGDIADSYGLNVIVENHGGVSSDGTWIADVMKRADHPRVGTLPDFGNFRLEDGTLYDKYKGIGEMMPFARAVSAKSFDFDAAGEETSVDYHRMLKIVVAAGYHRFVGIEYEGTRLPEPDGVNATKALCERVRDELTKAG